MQHLFNVFAVFTLVLLVGVEFSVFAFVNPSAWRLDPDPQARLLSHFAAVLGRVMPVWYPACFALLAAETWLYRHTASFALLVTATTLWFLASLGSIFFLVPLNNRVIASGPGWQAVHHTWDRRHRVRTVTLALAALLLALAVVG
jgi:hypothetical protein